MSNMTSESEERIMSTDSPMDEAGTERNMIGNGGALKKGPWTSAEDAILVEYVNKNGEGNWNAVQKDSGLSRCGKSCRLRWANHLRPDLKKGAFTPEEERKIIELHAKMGNKWARMAIELPGRTDNEIKNFWNTRTKRRQRAGLPIYPPDVCLQTLNDNTQSHNNGDSSSHPEIMPNNNFQIPAVEFKNMGFSHELFVPHLLDIPGPDFLDISGNTLLLPQTLGLGNTNSNSFHFPISHPPPPKRMRRSDPYHIYDGGGGLDDIFPAQSHDHDAFFNGNNTSSSSDPISWATKMELPSLQYSTATTATLMAGGGGGGGGGGGAPSSPLPSLESADTLIEKKTDRNSGLLEAVLYESQTLKMSKPPPRDTSSDDDEWEEETNGDPMSPLGHSAASVFSEYTPHITDDLHSLEAISVKHEALAEADEAGGKQCEMEDEKSNLIKYCRPDLLLDNSWFGSTSNPDHCGLMDPLSALLGDEFCNGSSHMAHPATVSGSPFDESAKWDEIS